MAACSRARIARLQGDDRNRARVTPGFETTPSDGLMLPRRVRRISEPARDVLRDTMPGTPLFTRSDEVERAWRVKIL